jgi:uncharacterized membrane protein
VVETVVLVVVVLVVLTVVALMVSAVPSSFRPGDRLVTEVLLFVAMYLLYQIKWLKRPVCGN